MYFILQDKLGKNCNKIKYETWGENKILFLNEFQELYFCLHIIMVKLGFYVKMRQKFGHMLNCGLVPISKSIPK
jgi:hypothetical protein